MKQPFLKLLLSYLFEINIENYPSEINPHLYVSLKNGRYQLSSANAIYSYGDLYLNFVKAFAKIDLEKINAKNVLVLGLGLGSIPIILEKKFKKNYFYTGVEIDEAVMYLANKYTLPELQSPFELIHTDAINFVLQTTEKFDIITMDIFLDNKIPEKFETEQFLYQLKELLNPQGVLLYNRLANSTESTNETKLFYEDFFKPCFPDSQFLDVGGNWILLNRMP